MTSVRFKKVATDGTSIFYRQAGPAGAPKLLLLHGFPTPATCFAISFRFSRIAITSWRPTCPASVCRNCRSVGSPSMVSRRRSIASRKR